jgi:ATP-dependent helicase/nuclease subunit A
VDAVFAGDEAKRGVTFGESEIVHTPVRENQPGLVELWPPLPPPEDAERETWTLPLGGDQPMALRTRLARRLARQIRYWTLDLAGTNDPECCLESAGRRIVPADILILVRRRGAFVEEVVRELKALDIPVAGIDRMVLTEQLAVQDLVALGRTMLQPEDDLTLACVLKGPIIGLGEEDLFNLAWNRSGPLWHALAAKARGSGPDDPYGRAWRELSALWSLADMMPPFEFFSEVLGPRDGRRRILGRLGADAADPLEEFLSLALSYERDAPPSLEGFLHWLEAGALEVKRDMEHGIPAVRVMTVHGSKGLQAPVVVLPDTLQGPPAPSGLFWPRQLKGLPFWPVRRDYDGELAAEIRRESRRLQEEEYRRLLYVAMTRAQDRLYVCGWENKRAAPEFAWYNLIKEGFTRLGESACETLPFEPEPEGSNSPLEPRLRVSCGVAMGRGGDTEDLDEDPRPAGQDALPEWARRPAPPEPHPPSPLRPSRPSAPEPSLLSPLARVAAHRFQRGLIIHRLLQALPEIPEKRRRDAARRIVEAEVPNDLPDRVAEIVRETMAVLESPAHSGLFGPRSRAEVPVIGMIEGRKGPVVVSGQVDRLVVHDDEVLIVDFKTNRPPPKDPAGVPSLYLGQMAAYRAVLERIYPGRKIRCFLLWTENLACMELAEDLLAKATP